MSFALIDSQDNYPENISYDRLRVVVKDAWEKVGEHEFRALIESMRVLLFIPVKVLLLDYSEKRVRIDEFYMVQLGELCCVCGSPFHTRLYGLALKLTLKNAKRMPT